MNPEPTPLVGPSKSAASIDDPGRLHGYAAVFGEPSEVLHEAKVCRGPFVEVIAPGAFSRSLRENPDILALFNHDFGHVLARTTAGNLTLREDENGLYFDLGHPDTQKNRDLREDIRQGNYQGCSFFGYVLDDDMEPREGLPSLRTIREIALVEVTAATARPAYTATTVALRSRAARDVASSESVPTPLLNLSLARLALARSSV